MSTPRQEQVLSTLNIDGTRKWIKPRPATGRFWHARRIVAYTLIALFTLIPYIPINGKPAMLLDIVHREFTFFGTTFYPTDTLLLALLVLTIFVSIFFATAVLGRGLVRVACPQTVYMEFVYRPIERFFEGKPGGKSKTGSWRKPVKLITYFFISLFLAHTFLAYFVGIDQLIHWVGRSPLDHPTAFLVIAFTTALMMFDFAFFREQTCIVACPYGRFQSVMLDRSSLIVGYDETRGEPRGKLSKPKKGGDVSLEVAQNGDCIDCHKCVTCCPTGIDIRNGLQMECIHCTQCIDACDDVMDKIGKPRGLIRYTSQAALESGKRQMIRPRTVLYPALLAILIGGFTTALVARTPAVISIIRGAGQPYYQQDDRILNTTKLTVRNRTDEPLSYTAEIVGVEGASIALVDTADGGLEVGPGELGSSPATISVHESYITSRDTPITVRVTGSDGYQKDITLRMVGPIYTPPVDSERAPGDG